MCINFSTDNFYAHEDSVFLTAHTTPPVHFCRAFESAQESGQHILKKGSFCLKAPIYNPQKLVCIGMNYKGHCTEQNIPVPKEPVIFSKFSSAITEPNGAVIVDEEETQVTFARTVICHQLKVI